MPCCCLQVCPLLKGAGVGTVVMSFLLGTYYNVIMAWALFYLFSCFSSSLPWENCDNAWNSPNCRPILAANQSGMSGFYLPTVLVANFSLKTMKQFCFPKYFSKKYLQARSTVRKNLNVFYKIVILSRRSSEGSRVKILLANFSSFLDKVREIRLKFCAPKFSKFLHQ